MEIIVIKGIIIENEHGNNGTMGVMKIIQRLKKANMLLEGNLLEKIIELILQ